MPRVAANGLELAYDEIGDPDGEPLVLIMGIGAQRVVWPPDFCEMLAERGFRVLRFDNRDVGESTWLTGRRAPPVLKAMARAILKLPVTSPYTLSDMADDTVGLLDALDIDSAHVVGASMGGMIAQHMAMEHPDRVRSLTSIMSGPGSVRHMIGRPSAIRALLSGPPGSRDEAMDFNEALFRVIGGDRPLDFSHIRERAGVSWDRGYNKEGFPRQWGAIMASGSRLSRLGKVRVPTLVVHGTADPLVPPRAGRATAKAIPGSTLQWVEGMGHSLAPSTWPEIVGGIEARAAS